MLNRSLKIRAGLCVGFSLMIFLSAQSVSASNIVGGTIFDRMRNPLNAVDVELLDEYYRLRQRTKTDSSGRYQFNGLNNGNYTVRVLPFQYDLQDQSQYVEVQAISARPGDPGSSYVALDFYLQPRKGGIKDAELSVVFVQEVPKEAEQSYEKAVDDFSKNRASEAFDELKNAIKIFPKYYLALHRFGTELFIRKQYAEAFQVLIKAVEVNPRSATSFYYMGYCFYNLGKEYNKAALTSLNQALLLAPNSIQVLLLIGKTERSAGKLIDAEKHLLLAKKLSTSKIPEIHKELSQLYANDLKKFKEAADELELYLKAVKLKSSEEQEVKTLIANLREKAKKVAVSRS